MCTVLGTVIFGDSYDRHFATDNTSFSSISPVLGTVIFEYATDDNTSFIYYSDVYHEFTTSNYFENLNKKERKKRTQH